MARARLRQEQATARPAFAKDRLRRGERAAKPLFRCPFPNLELSKSVQPPSRGRTTFVVSTTLSDCAEPVKLAGSTDLAQACEPGLLGPVQSKSGLANIKRR